MRRLADVETLAAPGCGVHALDAGDVRERGAYLQSLLELKEDGILAFGDHLDRSVGKVAGEPRDTEPFRFPQDEVAIPDALHAPAHEKPAGRQRQAPCEGDCRAIRKVREKPSSRTASVTSKVPAAVQW